MSQSASETSAKSFSLRHAALTHSGGALLGSFPLTTALTWHNGLHLVAPLDAANHPLPVRAVADGKVIYCRQPRPRNGDIDDPQNHNPYGVGAAWTDNGIVILRHTTEIGASGADTSRPVGTALVYYSVYMHLEAIDPAVIEGRPLWRKDVVGKAGHILGAADHIHFEICLDPDNLRQLLGPQRSLSWSEPDAIPTAHGRTDSVFGNVYVYLPAGTPTSATRPTRHLRTDHTTTSSTAQWVEIRYHKGDATISSYRAQDMSAEEGVDARSRSLSRCGSEIGTARTDKDFEYDLYAEATRRHDSLTAGTGAAAASGASPSSSPSGWYELLRFGRNLGTDPLPNDAAHWREIPTATGSVWADLNARGTWKFSDADFPVFKGWQCFDDDTSHGNQRCDSAELKRLIRDPSDPESIRNREALARRLGRADVRDKLRYAICRFPNEWDRNTIADRYSWLKVDETFRVEEGKEWEEFEAHAKAISFADLPQEYMNAIWHVHPRMFIGHMRMCGWLTVDYLKRIFPAAENERLKQVVFDINRFSFKYFLDTRLRQAHFFSQIHGETGPTMQPVTESWQYSPATLMQFSSYYKNHPLEAADDGYQKNEKGGITRRANENAIGLKHFGKKNGNRETHPGDGSAFRGRGLLQITGYDKYAKFRSIYNSLWQGLPPDSVENPEIINTHPYAIRSAVWFWGPREKLASIADRGSDDETIKALTRRINGGLTGIDERIAGMKTASKNML